MRALIGIGSLLILISGVFFVTGCSTVPIPTATTTIVPSIVPTLPNIVTATPVPSGTPTLAPSLTATASSPTAVVPPTRAALTTRASATRAPVPTAGMMKVSIFLIAINDNGRSGKKIGCDDSAVPVERSIPTTAAPLTAALKELLSIREQQYGQSGLYNALAQSNLKLAGVAISNGKATINLSGTLLLGGVCDNPRVAAQIQQTALQFPAVQQVAVFINGVPIERVLSEK